MGISCMRRVLWTSAWLVLAAAMVPDTAAVAGETQTISEVDVHEEDGVTRITMKGVHHPIYTAFMREDPRRLIIELPDVVFDGIDTPISVQNGLVSEVALNSIGDPSLRAMMRVSVALTGEAEYEVLPRDGEVIIEVRADGGDEAAASVPEPAPSGVEQASFEASPPASRDIGRDERSSSAGAREAEMADAPSAEAQVVSAGKILKVRRIAGGIEVIADGPIDNVDSFVLKEPARIVVDFWGVKSTARPDKQSFPDGSVARVRIGSHADKVRVVLDMRDASAAHKVVASHSGVRIEIESGLVSSTDPDEVMEPSRPANVSASASRAFVGVAKVLGARFESLSGVDRVVVEMDHEVKASVVEPDPQTVIVRILSARIEEDLERRVDTDEFGGPVEMFSIFQTPDIENEVRVILQHTRPSGVELNWDAARLTISVSESGRNASSGRPERAATPPDGTGDGESAPYGLDQDDPTADEMGGALAGSSDPQSPGASESSAPGAAPRSNELEALNAATNEAYGGALSDDDLLFGPADPASIDILEEGGFDEEKGYEGRRISLDFKDADIGNILRLIAEVSDLNVIAGDEVSGKVTIRLVDVPWDQALDVILLTKGLGFVRVGNVLRIALIETLKVEREARLQDRRAKEKLEDLIVKLQPVNYADVKDVSRLIEPLLSPRGSVNVDERTSTLIIKDIPSVIHEATALLKAIDTQTPQVLIEAKIVEASLNFSRSLGAIWGVGFQPQSSGLIPEFSRGGGGDAHFGNSGLIPGVLDPLTSLIPGLGTQSNNFIVANPVSAVTGLLTLGLLGADDHLQLDLQLASAEENRKGKVISAPRVVTIDNREAIIKQGVAIKFVEVTDDKITTSFVDAVLELKVTPHITANKSIIMKIKVSRNAPQLSAATGEVVGIDKNEATTEALVRDGETMVLGGIYVVESGNNRSKVPFLADIPLLGAAFRSSTFADERRELLIFVTPRIVLGPTPDAAL